MKRILAILVALATILSLSACGNYEINFKEKDDGEKSVVDSADENDFEEDEEEEKEDKKDKKDKENKKDKGDKDNEEETEEEIVVDGVPVFTKDVKKNKKLIEAYLKTIFEFKEFEEEEESDDLEEYGHYDMYYYKERYTDADIDYEIVIDGNSITMPTDLETLEECGFDFANSTYNEDSEFKKNTYGDIKMKNSDGESFNVRFLNTSDENKALSDCLVTRIDINPQSGSPIDFSFNGIGENSSLEDIAEEFGTPNKLNYTLFDDGRVYVDLTYQNWGSETDWEENSLKISFELTEEEYDLFAYEIPMYSFD